MRQFLKSVSNAVAQSRVMRLLVRNLLYPAVADCLRKEIQAGRKSWSGVVEDLAWKSHAYLVLSEELQPTGRDCSADEMRCDRETRYRIIDTVLACAASTEGDILEFGVYKGESLVAFSDRNPRRHVYGFDSFEGLPEDWEIRPKGTFKTELPNLDRPNITLIKGVFKESLPHFLNKWSGSPAIVHVDCCLYKSVMDCLMPVLPRCQVGTIILFDEYYNYASFAQNEWLAWREVRAKYRVIAQCIAYDGTRAAFQISDLGHLAGARRSVTVSKFETIG